MKQVNVARSVTNTALVIGFVVGVGTINPNNTTVILNSQKESSGFYFNNDYQNYNEALNMNVNNQIVSKNRFNQLEKEAQFLFGDMRDASEEERQSTKKYIDKISKSTGVNFFDLC